MVGLHNSEDTISNSKHFIGASIERWMLWPIGIPSAGAMRERGRQATAFVSLCQFDDTELPNDLFEPVYELVR